MISGIWSLESQKNFIIFISVSTSRPTSKSKWSFSFLSHRFLRYCDEEWRPARAFTSCFRLLNLPFLSLKFSILRYFTLHCYHNHIITYCNSLNIMKLNHATSFCFNIKFSSVPTQTTKSKINRMSNENRMPYLIFRGRALLIEWIKCYHY